MIGRSVSSPSVIDRRATVDRPDPKFTIGFSVDLRDDFRFPQTIIDGGGMDDSVMDLWTVSVNDQFDKVSSSCGHADFIKNASQAGIGGRLHMGSFGFLAGISLGPEETFAAFCHQSFEIIAFTPAFEGDSTSKGDAPLRSASISASS